MSAICHKRLGRLASLSLLLGLTACQTALIEGTSDNVREAWNAPPPAARTGAVSSYSNQAIPSPLGLRTTGEPVFFNGSGRFLGSKPTGSTGAAQDEPGDGVTLNLLNASVAQAAKTVLGDLLASKYTIDPGIDGKITLQTPGPIARSAALSLFQTALRSNNAALIYSGGAYKIVSLDQAALGANLQIDGDLDGTGGIASSLRVVQLKYVSASEIRRVVEPISPRGTIVRTDDARNTITLSGNDKDISGVLDAISVFDVDVMKGMSFGIVPVKASDPASITDELRKVFDSDREGPMAGMVRFLPNKRMGAILVITPQPQYLSRATTWIRRLDNRGEGSEKQFYTYVVQNRRATELVSVLQSMFTQGKDGASDGGSTRSVAPQYTEVSAQTSGMKQQSGASMQSGGMIGSQPSAPPATKAADTGPDTTSSIQIGKDDSTGGPRIKVVADEAKNTVLIEASAADYRRVARVIGTLDVIPNQVLIEAMIAEVTLKDELRFGLRWFLGNKNQSGTFTDDLSGSIGSIFPGFNYAVRASNIAATLTALNQITDVNVISSPSLTVADNRTAALQVGDQVPITTQSAVSVLTPGAPVVNSVSYKDTGVILSITPRISESGRVMLDIEQEVSTVSETTTSSINSPTISQRRVRTTVVVNDGEAFALGGLIQDRRTKIRSQIPVLGDIPIFGNAVRMKDDLIGKTELVIMIAPHVIRNLNEARQMTDEFRRELAIIMPYGRRPIPPRTPEQKLHRTLE
ncbi:type II secretion system secretin GspD [Bradyrhizobium yuanmingense]|uniref:type II secretion system secretin GspD n=1 Tax=Bradyrhizobium yuanmingense TaxID=108015 RepID=UPI0023B8937E|nr:type II secretion system secretin GspD [Bradyrhizobium yuanmingense]MDF0584158.1 type II secretion system secretin GspD [Bradyrhizobium yuanmingense]